jgi:hypothetical protein
MSFDHLQRLIYQRLKLLKNSTNLSIHTKMNIENRNNIYFSQVLIFDDQNEHRKS